MSKRTSRKVATWTIAASIVLLGVGAAGAWYAHVLRGRVSWALADNVTSIRAALKIQLVLREEQSALERFNISQDVADLRQALQLEPAIRQAAAEVTRFASTEYEYGIVGKMNDGLTRFFGRLHEFADALISEQATPTSAPGIERKPNDFNVGLLARDVLPHVTASLEFNEQELAERSRDNEAMASRLVLALVVLGVCGAAGGAALGYGLARSIRRKVYELSVPLRDVAGQLNQVVGPVTIDEDPVIDDLEGMLQRIAAEVGAVVEKLHATHRQVIRADQLAALGQLAAGLAHELHNPLMSIKILVQSARADGSPLEGPDLRVLDEEITRLQDLLQSFLNFARPAKLQRRAVDLRATVSQTVAFVSSRAARRKIAVRTCLPKRPVSINADEAQVRQVLLNLLLNALDAVADKGTIWVDVGPGSRLSPGNATQQTLVRGVFVAVADNGRGLPAANIERIFEPFFSTKETGLGLGLAICRQIVESHGGSIEMERGPKGVGAALRVFLPQTPLPTAEPPSVDAAALPALDPPERFMPKLLIVDDEPNLLYSLEKVLRSPAVEIITAETARDGIEQVRESKPDVVILDVRLPDMSGLDAFSEMTAIDSRLPVIMITAYSTMETAIEATKRGAYEYLLKPVAFDLLRGVVQRALESRLGEAAPMSSETAGGDRSSGLLIGQSTAMQKVYKAIGRIAPQDVTALIEGESGVGKELVAQVIYQYSRRNQGPLLSLDCAMIPEPLLEGELFGHERGAPGGAVDRRIGKLQQVDGGTLFLDEIGDLPLSAQAKLLRFLQDGSFERVGGQQTLRGNLRLIAATNQNLEELVEEGLFRRDLYHRLKVFAIRVPPLRERKDDVPILVEHFIRLFNDELRKAIGGVSAEALSLLQRHSWPGNVRELQSAVKYAMVHCVGDVITPDSLPASCREPAPAIAAARDGGEGSLHIAQMARSLLDSDEGDIYRRVHGDVDRILLTEVLERVGGNQVIASQLLGIARSTLRSRISDLGLTIAKRVLPDEGE